MDGLIRIDLGIVACVPHNGGGVFVFARQLTAAGRNELWVGRRLCRGRDLVSVAYQVRLRGSGTRLVLVVQDSNGCRWPKHLVVPKGKDGIAGVFTITKNVFKLKRGIWCFVVAVRGLMVVGRENGANEWFDGLGFRLGHRLFHTTKGHGPTPAAAGLLFAGGGVIVGVGKCKVEIVVVGGGGLVLVRVASGLREQVAAVGGEGRHCTLKDRV